MSTVRRILAVCLCLCLRSTLPAAIVGGDQCPRGCTCQPNEPNYYTPGQDGRTGMKVRCLETSVSSSSDFGHIAAVDTTVLTVWCAFQASRGSDLTSGLFSHLGTSLKELNILDCSVTNIRGGAFSNMPALHRLKVHTDTSDKWTGHSFPSSFTSQKNETYNK